MPRYKLILEYDGSAYAGWQKQPGQPSIQQSIEDALFAFCGEPAEVHGAGRTDAGVHAVAQTAHIDLACEREPYSIMQGINFYLFGGHNEMPNENRIAVTHVEKMNNDFQARFSAIRRHYLYRIINRRARLALEAGRAWQISEPLNEAAMNDAARHLLGQHDFTSFRDTQCQAKSPLKTLDHLQVRREGDLLLVETHARSFLHHQVRIMVGTLALVGKGKWHPDDVKAALEAKSRSAAGPTAPPDGLYLTQVDY